MSGPDSGRAAAARTPRGQPATTVLHAGFARVRILHAVTRFWEEVHRDRFPAGGSVRCDRDSTVPRIVDGSSAPEKACLPRSFPRDHRPRPIAL